MTRIEQQKKKLEEEQKLIKSLQHHEITSEQKGEFRKTSFWKNKRKYIFNKQKIDPITLSPLTKTYHLHHERLNSLFYTDLDDNYLLGLNNKSHDAIHWGYTQYCKDKNFLERYCNEIKRMYELNNGKDVKDFNIATKKKKEKKNDRH